MNIVVVIPFTENEKKALSAIAPENTYYFTDGETPSHEQLRQADILIGNVDPKEIQHASNLKWMQLNSAGVDTYIKTGVIPDSLILTNATGAYDLAISEHMLAMTLFIRKNLGLYQRNQSRHLWQDEGPVISIEKSTTLVIGLGHIGSEYARKMAMLGSHVYGIKRTLPEEQPLFLEQVGTLGMIDEWLPKADIVALALPGSPQTYHIMNAARFSLMKPSSILINVGRGTSVDTDALVQALSSHQIYGAAADVTDPEPLPADHPLWDCENFLLTPHVSGGYHLEETRANIAALSIENYRRFLNGTELINLVDRKRGY